MIVSHEVHEESGVELGDRSIGCPRRALYELETYGSVPCVSCRDGTDRESVVARGEVCGNVRQSKKSTQVLAKDSVTASWNVYVHVAWYPMRRSEEEVQDKRSGYYGVVHLKSHVDDGLISARRGHLPGEASKTLGRRPPTPSICG